MFRQRQIVSSAERSPREQITNKREQQEGGGEHDNNLEEAPTRVIGDASSSATATSNIRRNKRRMRPSLSSKRNFVVVMLAAALLVLLIFTLAWWSSRTQRDVSMATDIRVSVPPHDDAVHKVSVVVMNHSRPRMVRDSALLKTLIAHPSVSEILLCHSNPITKFEFQDATNKVINIDATQANIDMGLSLRFHYCSTAKNKWVIHVDDDMELSLKAVDDLLHEFSKNTARIVGKYGRGYNYWTSPQRSGYDTATLNGNVEVVLTKILILERRLCQAFFRYNHLVSDMVRAESKPLWNGEDIFVNLVANHIYKVPSNGPYNNYAIRDLDVWETSDEYKDDDTGAHDVSGNMDRHRPWNVGVWNWLAAYRRSQIHAAYRGRLWATAKARLAALTEDE